MIEPADVPQVIDQYAAKQRPDKANDQQSDVLSLSFLPFLLVHGFLRHRTIQERHDLGSRAVVAGTEQTVADTAGNAVLLRPDDRRRVVSVSCHIGEGGIAAYGRAAVGAPQEGDRLRSRTVAVGGEGHSAGAAGDALLNRP